MYLHEFQAKQILKKHEILIPKSFLLKTPDDINNIITFFNCDQLILKCQIHSGARKKFGGIKLVNNNYNDISRYVNKMLGNYLHTNQTDTNGKIINEILIEQVIKFEQEFYFSLLLDRDSESIILLASKNGGINIENNITINISKFKIDPLFGICDYQIICILNTLKLNNNYFIKLKLLCSNLLNIFLKNNLNLLEINPLVLHNTNFVCLDAKFDIDDNSYYKNTKLFELYDYRQDDTIETQAKKYNLNYISLSGNIGCIVNGAGLAMATMDLIKINNGNPANFLDIGGAASENTFLNAINIILLNKNINIIFINIFGGIIRCDLIAKSLITSLKQLNINIPIVIRLVGNMCDEALNIIKSSSFNITVILDFLSAVKTVINLSKRNI